MKVVDTQYVKADKLLSSGSQRRQFLKSLTEDSTPQHIQYVNDTFCHLLDFCTDGNDSMALEFLGDIWNSCFTGIDTKSSLGPLQQVLLEKRDVFIHVLINNFKYNLYRNLMLPLIQKRIVERSWADTLASTLEFQSSDRRSHEMAFNYNSVSLFIQNKSIPINQRRSMLAVFLRKGMILNDDKQFVIQNFLRLLNGTGDKHCLFVTPEFSVYKNAVYLVSNYIESQSSLDNLQSWFAESRLSKQSYYNFLTTLIHVNSMKQTPQISIKIWQYKVELKQFLQDEYEKFQHRHGPGREIKAVKEELAEIDDSESNKPEINDHDQVLNSKDLTFTIIALAGSRRFQDALNLSKEFPELYEEDQLVALLKVSAQQRNWKQLQDEFDDMYGKGQLPYAVHYSIVMNSLASLGATEDIDRLFTQLRKRRIQPIPSIYGALISVRLKHGELEQAQTIFEDFLISFPNIDTSNRDMEVADVYRIIMAAHLRTNDSTKVIQVFEDTVNKQIKDNIELIDSETIKQLIQYLADNYCFKALQNVMAKISNLDIWDEDIYASLIQAYTKLGQYELAEKLVFQAHHISSVPLKNAKIFAVQLKNYRYWYKENHDRLVKFYIESRRNYVHDSFQKGLANDNISAIIEIIKFYIIRRQISLAKSYLDMIIEKVKPIEELFIPFLKYNASQTDIKYHHQNLEIYRTMVTSNINLSLKTYEFVFKSVIFLDKHNGVGFENCTKLLQSIFEMNGLKFKHKDSEDIKEDIDPQADIYSSALYLCNMVSDYTIHIPGSQTEKAEFIVSFLSQLRTKMNDQFPNNVRFKIYVEMGNLYKQLNNLTMARSLIFNGINELNEVLTTYIKEYPIKYDYDFEIIIPKQLNTTFKALASLNLQILDQLGAKPQDYVDLYQKCRSLGVTLGSTDYNIMISKMIDLRTVEVMNHILEIVEDHLSPGNLNEMTLMVLFQNIYKLFIVEKSKSTSLQVLNTTYKWYNDFYNVRNIETLQKEMANVNIPHEVRLKLKQIKQRFPDLGDWDEDFVFNRPGIFFTPERFSKSTNKLKPQLANSIYSYLNECRNDQSLLFEFMDKYPAAMDIILFNQTVRLRLMKFRTHIDKVIEPPVDKQEHFQERRIRTLKALHRVFNN